MLDLIADTHLTIEEVDAEIATVEDQFFAHAGARGPAQMRTDTGDQFFVVVRFDNVVVCAHFQAAHHITGFAARCQKDDRHIRHFAQPLAYIPSVHVGHHDVQQHQVRLVAVGFAQPFFRPKRLNDFVPPALQQNSNELNSGFFVVYNQNFLSHTR